MIMMITRTKTATNIIVTNMVTKTNTNMRMNIIIAMISTQIIQTLGILTITLIMNTKIQTVTQ